MIKIVASAFLAVLSAIGTATTIIDTPHPIVPILLGVLTLVWAGLSAEAVKDVERERRYDR